MTNARKIDSRYLQLRFRGYFRCAGRMEVTPCRELKISIGDPVSGTCIVAFCFTSSLRKGVAWELDVLGTELGGTFAPEPFFSFNFRDCQDQNRNAFEEGVARRSMARAWVCRTSDREWSWA